MRLRSTPIPLAAAARATRAGAGEGGIAYLGSNLPGAGSIEIKR